MAQTDNRTGFWPKNPDAKITYLGVAASQTIAAGDPIVLSTGLVACGAADSAEIAGVAAQASASAAAGTRIACWIDPDEVSLDAWMVLPPMFPVEIATLQARPVLLN